MLSSIVINVKYLQESISFELKLRGQCCKFSCLYRSPGQTQDELKTFLKNFELPLGVIHAKNNLGDVNAKSNNWYKADITSLQGSKTDTITCHYGLNKLTLQPYLVMECGIHSSVHSNCHHQIGFVKFNLSIFRFMKELFGIMKEKIMNLS